VTRVAYLDCIGGIAGDMVLAAARRRRCPQEALEGLPTALGLEGVSVRVTPVTRRGIAATHVEVIDTGPRRARPVADLRATVAAARIPEHARGGRSRRSTGSRRPSGVHGVPADDLRLHELGSADTLVDCAARSSCSVARGRPSRLLADPVRARARPHEHGPIPSPGPAVLALLPGAALVGVETSRARDADRRGARGRGMRRVGSLPAMTLERAGYGAGTTDLADRPNVLRVVVGSRPPRHVRRGTARGEPRRPRARARAGRDRALRRGRALDVWTMPVQMKKGRPGVVVSALARPDRRDRGRPRPARTHLDARVRVADLRRHELEREHREVTVAGHAVGSSSVCSRADRQRGARARRLRPRRGRHRAAGEAGVGRGARGRTGLR